MQIPTIIFLGRGIIKYQLWSVWFLKGLSQNFSLDTYFEMPILWYKNFYLIVLHHYKKVEEGCV